MAQDNDLQDVCVQLTRLYGGVVKLYAFFGVSDAAARAQFCD